MGDIAIKIENLSKQYRLGVVGTQTLRGDLQRFWWKLRGKGDPTLKVGQENTLAERGDSEYVWALQDINLEIKKGEVLGIIGKNGAGKSTLLKILSRVTGPTTGTIKVNGRLASLLEVGTGFHPELTGRENIYLNGAILGMTRAEINKQFDAIVDFAGIAKYIDTPVKRYSSGMYVRLGFAVAAHLNSEILVVDEVLAVGDAEFQKKAIGKMQDVSKGQGRTVLFVSHNMASVKRLCTRAILLAQGKITKRGTPDEVINHYLTNSIMNKTEGEIKWEENLAPGDDNLKLLSVKLVSENGEIRNTFRQDENFYISINYKLIQSIRGYRFNINFESTHGEVIFASSSHSLTKEIIEPKNYNLKLEIPKYLLNKKTYIISINSGIPGVKFIFKPMKVLSLNIIGMDSHGSTFKEDWPGFVAPKLRWNIESI